MGDLKTTVEDLKVTVGKIDERTQGIAKVQHVILASIIAPLVVAIIAPIVYYILTEKIINKQRKSHSASTQPVQENQSEIASTNPSQVNEGKTVSTSTASSGFPEGKELEDLLKSDSHAIKEKKV